MSGSWWHDLVQGAQALATHPLAVTFFVTTYSGAFWLRSVAWRWVFPDRFSSRGFSRSFRIKTARLFLFHLAGLFLNHVLPAKAGDAARVFLVHKDGAGWGVAASTVFASRLVDVLALLVLGAGAAWAARGEAGTTGLGGTLVSLLPAVGALAALGAAAVPAAGIPLPERLRRGRLGREVDAFRKTLPALWSRRMLPVFGLSLFAWILEGGALFAVVWALGLSLPLTAAAAVTAFTLLGQAFQVTPGGLGSYELVMTLMLTGYGLSADAALAVAALTHGLKFVYSFAGGAIALWLIGTGYAELRKGAKQAEGKERLAGETGVDL